MQLKINNVKIITFVKNIITKRKFVFVLICLFRLFPNCKVADWSRVARPPILLLAGTSKFVLHLLERKKKKQKKKGLIFFPIYKNIRKAFLQSNPQREGGDTNTNRKKVKIRSDKLHNPFFFPADFRFVGWR